MIVVTGGAGFIGSCLVKELNNSGRADITIVDRLHSGEKWKNLNNLMYEDFIHADRFMTQDVFSAVLEKASMVFHLGACSSTTEKDADYLMKNNLGFSKALFNICAQKKIPFIYASSGATYGLGENGFSDSDDITDRLRPINCYGYSKRAFDSWAISQKSTPPVWVGLRFFNVFGPNEYHKEKMRSVVVQAFAQAKEKGEIRLFNSDNPEYADGEQLRDFIYVGDVVKAMIQISRLENPKSGIYNLGTGKCRNFNDLAGAVFSALEMEGKITYFDMPENLKGQYQYYTCADMDKFKTLLPRFEFMGLEESVKDYITNYLDKENRYY
ncbi:MAG: ADP-glyceromanno-heptose 6-epimerase [Bacteriovoracaceae bacterium]|jgi:ADP-L-glycero-D-manno-heptose 6-epimerase|nr:ADP-glyceromanno-heptose 6-epimerase [Bacteriovoracaceae bacterium]